MDHPFRILLIEDDVAVVRCVQRGLALPAAPAGRFRLERAATLGQGLDRIGKGEVDCVLLDLELPDSRGFGGLVRLREADPELPVVVLANAADPETALAALQRGAQDCLVKHELSAGSLLARSLCCAIERQRQGRASRRLEERRFRAEKLASLGVLSAGLALAFDEPLGAILDKADRLLEERGAARPGDREGRDLAAIRRHALRAAQLAEQLQDFAVASGSSRARPLDLSELVLETAEFVESAATRGVDVVFDLSGEGTLVEASGLELHQLLLALVTNAAEALEGGRGTLSIATGVRCLDRERLAALEGCDTAEPGRYAFLRVSDTGCGMDVATRARIFEPFFTTKRAGRGLGLAAVLGIVRAQRGVIQVESRPGVGTTVTVLLPVTVADAAAAA